jgi:hypothetical protein
VYSDISVYRKAPDGQQLVVSKFDMSGVRERKLFNNTDLSLAFAERKGKIVTSHA